MKRILITLSTFVFATLSQVHGQNAETKIASVREMIEFLSHDNQRGRHPRDPSINNTTAFLKTQLQINGIKPFLTGNYSQKFEIVVSKRSAFDSLTIAGRLINPDQWLLLKGVELSIKSQFEFVGHGLDLTPHKGKDLRGKTLIAMVGDGKSSSWFDFFTLSMRKREAATLAGAAGIIELVKVSEQSWNVLRGEELFNEPSSLSSEKAIFHSWVRDDGGLLPLLARKGEHVRANKNSLLSYQTENILAVIPGTDPTLKNDFILMCAHYDHLGAESSSKEIDKIYNGARDNAVGVAVVMETARLLATNPGRRSVLIALFSSEEIGRLGSEYFKRSGVLPINRIRFCLNSDNIDLTDEKKISLIGMERLKNTELFNYSMSEKSLPLDDVTDTNQRLFERSDNFTFALSGIPAVTYAMGFSASDPTLFRLYHSKRDHSETLNFEYLLHFARRHYYLVDKLANVSSLPTWK